MCAPPRRGAIPRGSCLLGRLDRGRRRSLCSTPDKSRRRAPSPDSLRIRAGRCSWPSRRPSPWLGRLEGP
eukprot:8629215-Alexandrium_andersonii.AAC.1